MPDTEARTARPLRGWPTVAGAAFAAGMILLLWIGRADAGTAADVLIAAAFVYLGSAALGLRAAAWPLFGVTFVLIGISLALPVFPARIVMLVIAAGLAAYGLLRWRRRPVREVPLQLAAMAVVTVLVLIATVAARPWAGIIAGIGLIAHALWDVRHLRSRRVVAPTMAEFCAALDVVLAGGVIVVALR